MLRYLLLIFVFFVALSLNSCAWFSNDNLEKPAQDLIQDGVDAYDRGRYRDSIINFEQLKDWYPFSKYAILAELKIADAHYNLDEFPEAIMAYEEFEQLHPKNEAIPYVIYQIGRCYYDQIDTIDRDQTSARKAMTHFNRLIQSFANNIYAQKAQSHILNCLKSLSGHELYVALFYYKSKYYEAALQRFLMVVQNYPDVGNHNKALYYIANCEALIKANASKMDKEEVFLESTTNQDTVESAIEQIVEPDTEETEK
ncbi:MAG: outer membrane protein assembly factor BamD [Desulfobacteraceae bacterium]|nr:outer membrane protein assembly factor BamD [Desulfobacteraceae bacterium]